MNPTRCTCGEWTWRKCNDGYVGCPFANHLRFHDRDDTCEEASTCIPVIVTITVRRREVPKKFLVFWQGRVNGMAYEATREFEARDEEAAFGKMRCEIDHQFGVGVARTGRISC
jgi:hypothetical protein